MQSISGRTASVVNGYCYPEECIFSVIERLELYFSQPLTINPGRSPPKLTCLAKRMGPDVPEISPSTLLRINVD